MALTCVYTVFDGQMYHENRSGIETEYVPDTNGNLWMTRDMGGNVTSSADYWPYGEVQSSTGTNPSPLGFGGVVGYITDSLIQLYVRARSYRTDRARWITVDPLWPAEPSYTYTKNCPGLYTDPTGSNIISGGTVVGEETILIALQRALAILGIILSPEVLMAIVGAMLGWILLGITFAEACTIILPMYYSVKYKFKDIQCGIYDTCAERLGPYLELSVFFLLSLAVQIFCYFGFVDVRHEKMILFTTWRHLQNCICGASHNPLCLWAHSPIAVIPCTG